MAHERSVVLQDFGVEIALTSEVVRNIVRSAMLAPILSVVRSSEVTQEWLLPLCS